MKSQKIKRLFDKLNVWKKGGERAPHKPLLALYALGRCRRGEGRLLSYADVDRDLRKLLMEFGPQRRTYFPDAHFVGWHVREVFRGPSRYVVG
jgi:putative restriction endonuclease